MWGSSWEKQAREHLLYVVPCPNNCCVTLKVDALFWVFSLSVV